MRLLMGLLAACVAMPTGVLMAWVLIESVQKRAFGWTMPFSVDGTLLLQTLLVGLLAEAGIKLTQTARSYRPHMSLPACEAKVLKPQNIVEMLHIGSRDVGFAGADWVAELDGELVELVDIDQQ